MHVEVDQSGKIADKSHTVLALSNQISYAVLIPASAKRECIQALRAQGKSGSSFYLQLFSAALFLLLKNYLNKIRLITIDVEYPSKDNTIKHYLAALFTTIGKSLSEDLIRFKRIGKKSRAHKKALAIFREPKKADQIIEATKLLQLAEKIPE